MHRARTLVIGGGAAGMMAAISASGKGGRVVLLEGGDRLGRKILVSGNGRCNLTNVDADSAGRYHSSLPGFARPALERFPLRRTLDFFSDLGIEVREERRGRLFPLSDQARSVVDLLEDRLRLLEVEVVCGAKVDSLEPERNGGFRVGLPDGRRWKAGQVVMACGGRSAPQLGADRSGLELAAGLGHSRTRLYPGLVSLISPDPFVRRMQGTKVRAEVRLRIPGRPVLAEVDDLLLTRYGVSGFSILSLSLHLVPLLEKRPVSLQVNLFPGRTPEWVSEMLKARWERNPHRSLEMSFVGLFPDRLVGPFLERFGLPAERRVDRISKRERWHLAQSLTCWPIEVTEPRSFEFAEVTIGGVRVDQIDPESLESRLVPGLYFAGEMLDVQGDLGGFNLQWAWSSGWVAGLRLGS